MGNFFSNVRAHLSIFGSTSLAFYAPWNDAGRYHGEAFGIGTWPAFLIAMLVGEPSMFLYQTVAPFVIDWPRGVWLADVLSAVTEWAHGYAERHSRFFVWLPADSGEPNEIGFHYCGDLVPAWDDPDYATKRPRMWAGARTVTMTAGPVSTYAVRYDGQGGYTTLSGEPIQTTPTC